MLLFNPSPGQIADRMYILELKREAARTRGLNTEALDIEFDTCRQVLNSRSFTLTHEFFSEYTRLSDELETQNKTQWRFENKIRQAIQNLSEAPSYVALQAFFELAKGTHLGNEKRAELVAAIDELFNISVERKIYL